MSRVLGPTLCGVLFVLGGCGGVAREQPVPAPVQRVEARRCVSQPSTPASLTESPDWAGKVPDDGWTDPDGCLVRLDVIGQRQGPAHCGWQAATVISTGVPVATRWGDVQSSTTYVRDPDNVFGDTVTSRGFDANAFLPKGAVDTGYRRQGVSLWMIPYDASEIFLVDDRVERWPRDLDPSLCA